MVIREKVSFLRNAACCLRNSILKSCHSLFTNYADIYSTILNANSEGLNCRYNNTKFYWILVQMN
ncbi:hypothetical protein [Bacillus subtilis]|uniref:hypothetical protein n=1 Tax=Bacillus subtilis TaxID=1423 RepID=UPI003306D5F0